MIKCHEMTSSDAISLEILMSNEDTKYLAYFTAFREKKSLHSQLCMARKDKFFSLKKDGELAGFFCLRGLDEGYRKPSFGVYILSNYSGMGLARRALREAEEWCKKQSVRLIMLKVAAENRRAFELYLKNGYVAKSQCLHSEQIIMEKRVF